MDLWVINIIRMLAAVFGLVALYLSIFQYEDQEGRMQNILENIWIKIDDYKKSFLTRQTLFMREVATFTGLVFERIFGKHTFSLRAVLVSSCYSIASICLIISYKIYNYDLKIKELINSSPPNVVVLNTLYSTEYGVLFLPLLVTLMIWFLVLGTIPVIIKREYFFKIWKTTSMMSILLAVYAFYRLEYNGWTRYFSSHGNAGHISFLWENPIIEITDHLINRVDFIVIMFISYIGGILLGFLADILFIAVTRKLLRWASNQESFFRIFSIILFNCFLALILCLGPATLGYGIAYILTGHSTVIPNHDQYPENFIIKPFSLPLFAQGFQLAGFVSSLSNIITSLFAITFVIFAIIFIFHRILWPVMEKASYALQKIGIASRRKLLGTLGLLFCTIAYGRIPSWLQKIAESFF